MNFVYSQKTVQNSLGMASPHQMCIRDRLYDDAPLSEFLNVEIDESIEESRRTVAKPLVELKAELSTGKDARTRIKALFNYLTKLGICLLYTSYADYLRIQHIRRINKNVRTDCGGAGKSFYQRIHQIFAVNISAFGIFICFSVNQGEIR